MQNLETIHDYLRCHSDEIGERILCSYPALHGPDEAPSPLVSRMLRTPYPAQSLGIMGISERWQLARNGNIIAECGAGKTLIALGSMLVHSAGNPFCALVMSPPHLVELDLNVRQPSRHSCRLEDGGGLPELCGRDLGLADASMQPAQPQTALARERPHLERVWGVKAGAGSARQLPCSA